MPTIQPIWKENDLKKQKQNKKAGEEAAASATRQAQKELEGQKQLVS